MQPRSLLQGAVPTPFGWLINAQSEFDLEEMLAFRSQLISLTKVFGKAQSPEMCQPIKPDEAVPVRVPQTET